LTDVNCNNLAVSSNIAVTGTSTLGQTNSSNITALGTFGTLGITGISSLSVVNCTTLSASYIRTLSGVN
jgi:hypothetical protein